MARVASDGVKSNTWRRISRGAMVWASGSHKKITHAGCPLPSDSSRRGMLLTTSPSLRLPEDREIDMTWGLGPAEAISSCSMLRSFR
ncbi:hypothetical protein D3C78_1639090 [compost metagenome]